MALSNPINNLEWLNKEYIEKILNKNQQNDEIKVKNLKLESATGNGENYCAIVTRMHIEYETFQKQTKRMIIKSSFENDKIFDKLFKGYDIISKEMDIYNNCIPEMNALLKGINDNDVLFPEVVVVNYEKLSIILEDLGAKSFVMADRLKGLDSDHIKLALRKLAKMHATSAVVNKNSNGSLEKFDRGLFNRYTDSFLPIWKIMLNDCSEMIKEFEGSFVEYSAKLKKLIPYLMEYGLDVFSFNPNYFNVLVHGDFWTNNLMFKYNEKNEPVDAVLLDFQYCCWGSPAIDLHYFLNNSITENLTTQDQEEFVQFYYYQLANTLKELNFNEKIPSLKEFYIQYLSKSFYGLVSTCLFLPIMLNENTEDANVEVLTGEDERGLNFKKKLYENVRVKNIIRKRLPIYSRRGFIDIH